MRFLLIIFIFFSCYSSLYANEIFNLLKIPNLEVLDINSKNKIKYFNTKENFIIGATQNIVCDKVRKINLNNKIIFDLWYCAKIYQFQVFKPLAYQINKKEH